MQTVNEEGIIDKGIGYAYDVSQKIHNKLMTLYTIVPVEYNKPTIKFNDSFTSALIATGRYLAAHKALHVEGTYDDESKYRMKYSDWARIKDSKVNLYKVPARNLKEITDYGVYEGASSLPHKEYVLEDLVKEVKLPLTIIQDNKTNGSERKKMYALGLRIAKANINKCISSENRKFFETSFDHNMLSSPDEFYSGVSNQIQVMSYDYADVYENSPKEKQQSFAKEFKVYLKQCTADLRNPKYVIDSEVGDGDEGIIRLHFKGEK